MLVVNLFSLDMKKITSLFQSKQKCYFCNEGLPSTPSQGDWLSKVLPVGGRVGVDPFLMATGKVVLYSVIKGCKKIVITVSCL